MKWRKAVSTLLVLLMPLPLVWLISIAMSGHGSSERMTLPPGRTLVPMLSLEERLRLPTYAHDCRTDADCDHPLRCAYDVPTSRYHCTDSLCTGDEHCPQGFACIPWSAENDKDMIGICSLTGVRTEGELCQSLPESPKDGCAKGLFCHGFCGRPCRVDESASCPEGYYCHSDKEGSYCMPTCEDRPCPAGQRCIGLMAGQGSVCMTIHGQDCEQTPCPQGQHCTLNANPRTPGHIWMECLQGCGTSRPPCPEETACFLFQCRKSCDPENTSACGPGFRCGRNHPSQPWVCVPDPTSTRKDS
ncbi:hypothetical protein ATI61_108453 [Archangium gephyra]|uniref:Uncharacterized protein n=1 Tax=Archangium gephyra TaxID=48 RepID=A0ABX9JXF9_9BACT|nr:hypothetical protein ATI61_108453 [Archangium gephyra]